MDSNGPNNYLFGCFPTQIIAFVVIEFSYLRFSCHFRPRPESATFLLATMLVSKVYPYQTKILEGGTKDEIRIFEALFNCSSVQNLRVSSTDTSACYHHLVARLSSIGMLHGGESGWSARPSTRLDRTHTRPFNKAQAPCSQPCLCIMNVRRLCSDTHDTRVSSGSG